MLEETPDELRAKKLEEQREKVEAVKAQLGGTLELMKKNKPKRDDGLEGHRQMALLRELEGDEANRRRAQKDNAPQDGERPVQDLP